MEHFKRKLGIKPIIGIYQIKNNINQKVYIGKSIDIERRWEQHKYSKSKNVISLAIKKYGISNFDFSIIEKIENLFDKNDIENRLTILEQKWMDINKSYNKNFGYNINKLSKPNLTPIRNNNFGDKISKIKIEMNHCGKPINQYTLNGDFIKEWKSAADIERTLGFYAENISASCLRKSKKSNNFIWRFKDDVLTDDDVINVLSVNRNRKKIEQLSKNDELLREFDSLNDAALFLGVKDNGNITHVCMGRQKTYKGYKWRYKI